VTPPDVPRDVWSNPAAQALAGLGARRRHAPCFSDGEDASWTTTAALTATMANALLTTPERRRTRRLNALLWYRGLWQRRAAYRLQSPEAQAQAAEFAWAWEDRTMNEATDLVLVRLASDRPPTLVITS
jgi:hypothetical protein